MLPATPQYNDDSEDSDDEDWLRDGRVKYRPNITLQGVFRPMCSDPCGLMCEWTPQIFQNICSP